MSRRRSLLHPTTLQHDIEVAEASGTFRRIYSLRANREWTRCVHGGGLLSHLCVAFVRPSPTVACCGRTSNCCAPSCCFPNAVYDVLDADGNVVSHLQKPFAGRDSCCKAWCRDAFKFSNYILSMPDESLTDDERVRRGESLRQVHQRVDAMNLLLAFVFFLFLPGAAVHWRLPTRLPNV